MSTTKYLTLDLTDMDECKVYNNGGCNQTCVNVPGSYKCACIAGFALDMDGKRCSGNIQFSMIVFMPLMSLVSNENQRQCISEM